jgi:predicted aldo/keto reductase-like oxidoreductase
MEPLRGGLLAKQPPPEIASMWDTAEEKRSPAEWALRWVWNHPEVTVLLSGMNESAHIQENIRIASDAHPGSLSDEETALIKRVAREYRRMMKAGCTGCHYCMPCPHGVDIPTCFETYNHMHMFKDVKFARLNYMARVGGVFAAPARASQCEECQECEAVCPQQLPISALLKEVASEMEGRFFDAKVWAVKKFMRFKEKQAFRTGAD